MSYATVNHKLLLRLTHTFFDETEIFIVQYSSLFFICRDKRSSKPLMYSSNIYEIRYALIILSQFYYTYRHVYAYMYIHIYIL